MGASYDRLTGYAIVSAMERDARDLLRRLASQEMLNEVIDSELIHQLRLRADNDELDSGTMSASELLEFTDFSDLAKLFRKLFAGQKTPPGVATFIKELDRLQKTRNRVMHSRPLRRSDLPQLRESLAVLIDVSDLTLPACLDVSVTLKANPDYVLSLEFPVHDREKVFENLPLPDYDETGLIGREPDVAALLNLLRSPREVISLIGEGGVGKSAVAVETLYELLDSEANPYEAIVWTSLKTTGFGPAGIRSIRNEVVSTLTLYSDIAQTLGLKNSQSVDELVTFLSLFPTLLVIDNLEAINSGEIRDLLRQVPRKSKVLITSRIGVGELEERYVLDPLSRQSSIQLVRSLARNLNVPVLVERSNVELGELCGELYDIPLALKWYVGAVANGIAPNLAESDKSELLDYCFANVYHSLPDEPKALLRTFQFAKRALTAAELAYLSSGVSDYRKALNLLLGTSVLRLTTDRRSKKTVYVLTEFAAAYLRQHAPPPASEFSDYLKRESALSTGEQSFAQSRRVERYSPFVVSANLDDRDLQVAAIYLRQATAASRASQRDEAFKYLNEAMRLCPEHSEVYKISAAIHTHFGEYFVADEHYQIAINIADEPAPIKALYAQFLHRILNSRFIEAATLADEAYADDPCVPSALISMRANLYIKVR